MPGLQPPAERIRVAYVFLDLDDGGAERLTVAACREMDRDRLLPQVLCLRGGGALVDEAVAGGLHVHSLGRLRGPRDWRALGAAARWFRSAAIDVAHVQLYSRASPYARGAAKLARVPLIVAHEWCRPSPPRAARAVVDRALAPGTRYVATSRSLARDLIASGAPARDVEVVHSGIDTDAHAPRDRAACRRMLDLPPDRPVLLVPARLHPMKGHVDLIAALPRVLQGLPATLTLLAGDGPLRAELPALVRAAGLEEAVRFLGRRSDIPLLMGAADVVVLPSRVEGLPSAMLEALCGERPVVATAVGGVPEVMVDGLGGWVVPPREPAALARALLAALADPAGAGERARSGHALVLRDFRARDTAMRLERLYRDWLAIPRTSVARAGQGS